MYDKDCNWENKDDVATYTNKKREEYAQQVFDLSVIKEAIRAAAELGYMAVRIEPARPVDLRQTKYAQGMIEKLRNKWGYSVEEPNMENPAVVIAWGDKGEHVHVVTLPADERRPKNKK